MLARVLFGIGLAFAAYIPLQAQEMQKEKRQAQGIPQRGIPSPLELKTNIADRCTVPPLDQYPHADAIVQEALQQASPAWLKRHGIAQTEWDALDSPGRFQRLREAVHGEACQIARLINLYYDQPRFLVPGDICKGSPEEAQEFLAVLREISDLRVKYPHGFKLLLGDPHYARSLKDIQDRAKVKLARLGMAADQCQYGQARMAAHAEAAILQAGKGFSGPLDRDRLDKAFENAAAAGPGSLQPAAVQPGVPPGTPQEGGPVSRKGLKSSEVPGIETFEGLTEGIVFSGPDTVPAFLGLFQVPNRKKRVFEEALRHLYAIPEGRKVLRDIQEMRGRLAEEFREKTGEYRAAIPKWEKELEELAREATQQVPPRSEEGGGRIWIDENHKWGGSFDPGSPSPRARREPCRC